MNQEELKGKKIVEAIIVVLLLIIFGLQTIPYLEIRNIEILPEIYTMIFALVLCYYLHKAKQWARYITALMLVMLAFWSGFAIILTFPFQPITVMMVLLLVIYGIMADQLLLSKSVKAYFEFNNPKDMNIKEK